MNCSPPDSSVHGDSPGKNTGVGGHFLPQGILLTQGSNPRSAPPSALQADSLPTEPPGKPLVLCQTLILCTGFPGSSAGKEATCNAGGLGLIPGLGGSPGEGKGYPLQYSGLENSMDCVVSGHKVRHD